jgi:hypothetical protein
MLSCTNGFEVVFRSSDASLGAFPFNMSWC